MPSKQEGNTNSRILDLMKKHNQKTPDHKGQDFIDTNTPENLHLNRYAKTPEINLETPESLEKKTSTKNVQNNGGRQNYADAFSIENTPEHKEFDWNAAFLRFTNKLPKSKNQNNEKAIKDLENLQILDLADFTKMVFEQKGRECDVKKLQEIESFWQKTVAEILGKSSAKVSDEDLTDVANNLPEIKPMIMALKTAQWAYYKIVKNDAEQAAKLKNEIGNYNFSLRDPIDLGKGQQSFSDKSDKFIQGAKKQSKKNFPEEALKSLVQNSIQEEEIRNLLKKKSKKLLEKFNKLDEKFKTKISKSKISGDVSVKLFNELFIQGNYESVIDQNFINDNFESTRIWFREVVDSGNHILKKITELSKQQKQKDDLEIYLKDIKEAHDSLETKTDISEIINSLTNRDEDIVKNATNLLNELFSSNWKSLDEYLKKSEQKSLNSTYEKIRNVLDAAGNVFVLKMDEQEARKKLELERALEKALEEKTRLKTKSPSPNKRENLTEEMEEDALSESSGLSVFEKIILNPQSTRKQYNNATFEVLINDAEKSVDSLGLSVSVQNDGKDSFKLAAQTPIKTPVKQFNSEAKERVDSALKALSNRGGSGIKQQVRRLQFVEFASENIASQGKVPALVFANTPIHFSPSSLRNIGRSDSVAELNVNKNLFYSETPQKLQTPAKNTGLNNSIIEEDHPENNQEVEKAIAALQKAHQKLYEIDDYVLRNNIIALSLGHRSAAGLEKQRTTKYTTNLIETFVPLSYDNIGEALNAMNRGFASGYEKDSKRDINDVSEKKVDEFSRFVCQVAEDISDLLVAVTKKIKESENQTPRSSAQILQQAVESLKNHEQKVLQEFRDAGFNDDQIAAKTRNVAESKNPSTEVVLTKVIKDKNGDRIIARPVFGVHAQNSGKGA